MAMPETIKCITNILFTRGRSAFPDALKQTAPVTTSPNAFGGHHLGELWDGNSLSCSPPSAWLSSVPEQCPGVTNQDKHAYLGTQGTMQWSRRHQALGRRHIPPGLSPASHRDWPCRAGATTGRKGTWLGQGLGVCFQPILFITSSCFPCAAQETRGRRGSCLCREACSKSHTK